MDDNVCKTLNLKRLYDFYGNIVREGCIIEVGPGRYGSGKNNIFRVSGFSARWIQGHNPIDRVYNYRNAFPTRELVLDLDPVPGSGWVTKPLVRIIKKNDRLYIASGKILSEREVFAAYLKM